MLLQWGQVSIAQQEIPWNQPELSAYGQMGVDDFACSCNGCYSTNYGWRVFQNTTSYWLVQGSTPHWLSWYIKIPTKITRLTIVNSSYQAVEAIRGGQVQACNDGTSWINLKTWSNTVTAKQASWNIDIDYPGFYNYYRLYIQTAGASYGYSSIETITITGYNLADVANSIVFPTAYTSDYAFSLGNVGSYNTSYCTSRTTTGMTLYNPQQSQGTMKWFTIGY